MQGVDELPMEHLYGPGAEYVFAIDQDVIAVGGCLCQTYYALAVAHRM